MHVVVELADGAAHPMSLCWGQTLQMSKQPPRYLDGGVLLHNAGTAALARGAAAQTGHIPDQRLRRYDAMAALVIRCSVCR